MNYDGLAFVVDCSKNIFKSSNGYCYVFDPLVISNPIVYNYNSEVSVCNTDVTPQQKKYISESYIINNNIEHGITPITVNVVSSLENIIKFYPVMIQSIYVKNNDKKQYDIKNYESTAFVSIVDRTNVMSKEFAINVVDKSSKDKNIILPFVTVNVTDKTQITVPGSSELTGFTIVLQKNNFTEIKFQKTLSLVTGLPEGLEQKGQIIKGTITKSGNYTVSIIYSNGIKQILNIIVPYYQRLL